MATRIKWRRLNLVTHRDIGYIFSSLLVGYCLSGLALNHADDWNPDFVVSHRDVQLDRSYTASELSPELVRRFSKLVGEEQYRVYDQPTPTQVKIYFDNASLQLHLDGGKGEYERIGRRPMFFQLNALHRNSLKAWRWMADAFAVALIALTLTGLLILRGRDGLGGRGKWLLLAGGVPPLLAAVVFELK
ncbi:MAG: PepSY-associated TM helix domain-containing protein [Myxococcaceae bacterium]